MSDIVVQTTMAPKTFVEPLVAYHGTPHPEQVLEEGLRADNADGPSPCIWMALDPRDAMYFGTVVEIDLTQLQGSWPRDDAVAWDSGDTERPMSWQAHYAYDIPARALRAYDG